MGENNQALQEEPVAVDHSLSKRALCSVSSQECSFPVVSNGVTSAHANAGAGRPGGEVTKVMLLLCYQKNSDSS